MSVLKFHRFISTGIWKSCFSSGGKTPLAKLRKKTGYSIINCKKALEQNNNELVLAEKWLHEEAVKQGWAKAAKMQNRSVNYGLIGLDIQKTSAALVEVACETDFVARNEQFKDLVKIVANTCSKHIANRLQTENNQLIKCEISSLDISNLSWENKRLSDRVALAISHLGENIVIKRGTVWQVDGELKLGGAIHPSQPQSKSSVVGSYGSLVAFKCERINEKSEAAANQLSVHIIGMNPKMLTREISPSELKEEQEREQLEVKEQEMEQLEVKERIQIDENKNENDDVNVKKEETKDESALLLQKFLFNEDLTVKEFVDEHGLQIIDFLRFECGESK